MLILQCETFMRAEELAKLKKEIQKETTEPVILLPNCISVIPGKVFYKCDRKACEVCRDDCEFTADIAHAANFKSNKFGVYEEV